jgi:hypothetical protein
LASGNIVEDMQLGIDLAIVGSAPVFCPTARVVSELPGTESASRSQRIRWIHGHLKTLFTQTPQLLIEAARQRSLKLLALAAELSVPPLSLLALALAAILLALTYGWLLGGPALPAAIAVFGSAVVVGALLLALARFGGQKLSTRVLVAIPGELLSRVLILLRFVFKPQMVWIRTERRSAP